MKNLRLVTRLPQQLQLQIDGETLVASAIDAERRRAFFASSANFIYTVSLPLSFTQEQQPLQWSKIATQHSDIDEVVLDPGDCIVAMDYLMERESLLLGSSAGCLVLYNVEEKTTEVVGRLEGGVNTIACSPDGALLSVTTGLGQLLVITQDWEVLFETSLNPQDATIDNIDSTGGQIRSTISWRGDGKYFATLVAPESSSSLTKLNVWERESGKVHSSSDAKTFMGASLDWMPSGAKVATALDRRTEGKCPLIIFYENGLERSHFSIDEPAEVAIQALKWNCNSEILAALVSSGQHDVIKIWTCRNNHWYLKHELRYTKEDGVKFFWDPTKPMHLICWRLSGRVIIHKSESDKMKSEATMSESNKMKSGATMSESDKMKSEAVELAKLIAQSMLDEQTKRFEEQMKKIQEEIIKMREELSKKVDDVISGTSMGDGAKDNTSDVGGEKETTPHAKGGYSNIDFDYTQLIKAPTTTINLGKPPHFDGTRYTDWAYRMKMYLTAAGLWEIVDVGVHIPTNETREMTAEEAYDLQQNAQVVSLIISCLCQDEFNKVNGIENAKLVWDTLKVSYESDRSVRKVNIELLQCELERFVFLKGETTQMMFGRLMVLVNRMRALGNQEWDDKKVARKMLRTYMTKNSMLASAIMDWPGYEDMRPQELLAKIKHHECLQEDAINAHNKNPNAMGYNKNAAPNGAQQYEGKASKQDKKKKVKDDSLSEEEESDEEAALIIRNYRRFLKKKSLKKTYGDGNKRSKKRFCYGCGDIGHFIADCPKEKKGKYNKDDDKNKKRDETHIGQEWESNDDSDDEKKGAANTTIHKTSSLTKPITDTSSSPIKLFTNKTSPPKLFPNLASSPRLFSNLIDDDYSTPTFAWKPQHAQ